VPPDAIVIPIDERHIISFCSEMVTSPGTGNHGITLGSVV
jgi:hypothetical protein